MTVVMPPDGNDRCAHSGRCSPPEEGAGVSPDAICGAPCVRTCRSPACHTSRTASSPGKRPEIREGGQLLTAATIGHPIAGIGVLRRIGATPAARRRGLGPALLGSALDLLKGLGAVEPIHFVDDTPDGDPERDRTTANSTYDRADFTEIDRLHSFIRRQQTLRAGRAQPGLGAVPRWGRRLEASS
ncbi:GNAT family N-acetyltransferase [Streptomyces sp. NPDC058157]|uniref:GNAT family N-acetyltransferase n=1 Tax=Streptomyces sp. NPDC058157 TaxID=3346360 RepID=UPI0036E1E01C